MSAGRFWARTDLVCFLNMASGGKSPDTKPRTWFFEIPEHCHDAPHWLELVPRIFYDLNVNLRRRQPDDAAWISAEDFKVNAINIAEITAGDGSAELPWTGPDKERIWEPAVCYFVNDLGQYDVMSGHDYTELLLHRALQANTIPPEKFISFLDRQYAAREANAGQRIHANAAERFKNLVTVRSNPVAFRKQPGAQPFVCGPVEVKDI